MSTEALTVIYSGTNSIIACPIKISEYCDLKPAIPESMLDVEPQTSYFLDAIAAKHEESTYMQIQFHSAISERIHWKEVKIILYVFMGRRN